MSARTGPKYDYGVYYRNWYDGTPEQYEKLSAYKLSLLRPWLPPAGEEPVLDIGCGMGFALEALKRHGFKNVYGIDSDEGQLKECRKHGFQEEFVEDAIPFLEARPRTYRVILMLDVLEHIPVEAQIPVLRAVYGALTGGGRLIVTVPNASSILACRSRYMDYTHHNAFTEHSLHFVLKNAGFDRVEVPQDKPVRRSSLRLWKKENRLDFRRWFIRWAWRQVLKEFYGMGEDTDKISCELNLLCVADKGI